jgi:hypothetical protein
MGSLAASIWPGMDGHGQARTNMDGLVRGYGISQNPLLHPSSLIPHSSSFIPHPSSLILHPSSFHHSLFILFYVVIPASRRYLGARSAGAPASECGPSILLSQEAPDGD